MKEDIEYYFIQLLFCRNIDFLRAEFRKVYDGLFLLYKDIYNEGRKNGVDVMTINKKFVSEFATKSKK